MGNGWIKLHRKLIEKGFFKKSQYVHLWLHLLLSANHKPTEYMTNGKIVLIKAGQFITGRKMLSEDTGIPESTIEDILKFLENEQQIQQQKTTKYRLVTIVNWKEYQESDNRPTTTQQQADTNKNDKNEKNIPANAEVKDFPIGKDEPTKRESTAKYPNALTTFSWFPNPQKSWESMKNVQEREYAEYLFSRGEEAVKQALRYLDAHKGEEFLPKVTKPSDLEKKWEDIKAYAKRNG